MSSNNVLEENEQRFLKQYPWITKDLFEEILQTQENDKSILITDIQLEPALAKGENYNSQMIRVKLTYFTNKDNERRENGNFIKRSMVIKTYNILNENEKYVENDMFTKEISIFNNIMPVVRGMLSAKGVDNVKLAAYCYKANNNPAYLIYEDLVELGFQSVDRKVGLSFEQLQLCLTEMAKWHAATAVFGAYEKNADLLEVFKKPPLTKETTGYFPLFRNSLVQCAEVVSTWPGFELISEKISKLQSTIIDQIIDVYKVKSRFKVLTHGDLWVNNIMYKISTDGKAEDVVMVDYANGYWGSLGIDLSYLLYTSSEDGVKESQWNQLIEHYHKELNYYLTLLDYSQEIPTLADVHWEIEHYSMYTIGISIFLIGLRYLEDTANADLSSLLGNAEKDVKFRQLLVGSEKYRKTFQHLVKFYNKKGYLD